MTKTREENAADMAAEEARPKTKAITIASMIAELIETHMAKCDGKHSSESVHHVISEAHGSSADIKKIGIANPWTTPLIRIELDDGTAFNITVEKV